MVLCFPGFEMPVAVPIEAAGRNVLQVRIPATNNVQPRFGGMSYQNVI